MTELEGLKKLLADGDDALEDLFGMALEGKDTLKRAVDLRNKVRAAVNALPGLIARVEEMEAALQEIARCERYLSEADTNYEYEMRQIELCRLIKTRAALRKEP